MALSTKLMMRQGQSLVMTPQLLQAIKLLQLSGLELTAFVEEELERNPLLERVEDRPDPTEHTAQSEADERGETDFGPEDSFDPSEAIEAREGDWATEQLDVDTGALERNLGTEVENTFDSDRAATPLEHATSNETADFSATSWTGAPGGAPDGEAPNLEAYVASQRTLGDHLVEQLAVAVRDPVDRLIGHAIIDSLDETGYLAEPVEDIAGRLGAAPERAEAVLKIIQT